jgi:hypothetical protein
MTGPDDPLRPGSKLNPVKDPDSPAGQLAQSLRELTGGESLRQLARRVPCGTTTISDALSGDPRKVPTTTIIEGICKARGADAPTLERLLDMRAEANRQKPPDPPPLDRAPGEADDPVVSGSPDGRGEVGVTDPPGGNSQQHPERWWSPRPAVLVVVVLSLVLATAVAWGINTLVNACGGPGSGVSRVDGECVGVTDGSYVFDPALADVEAKIAAENARVAGSGHTVTVALLNLMTVNNTSPVSLAEVVNQLEGAYTAQYRANQTNDLGDPSPLIRLVLANEGSHENQWQPVVHQIEGMVGDQDPLVAVTGLGVSVKQTEDGAKDLAAHHIPMVGALTTADELNYKNIPGFIRVAPSDAEYVQSLLAYLQHRQDPHRQDQQRQDFDSAILVYDTNSDDSGDLFTRSLRNNLRSGMKSLIKSTPAQGFTGTSGQSPGNPDLFSVTTGNICAVSAVKPPVILFAGRALDLLTFLQSLEARICSDKPMTVLTANTNLGTLDEAALEHGKITVVNAAASDPADWANNVLGTPPHFGEFISEFRKLGFDPAHLHDGDAIANHDALATAIKAARLAASQAPSSQNGVPKLIDVSHQMLNLNTLNLVPGASGNLTYQFRGQNGEGEDSGNPCDKPIPILEVPPYKPPAGMPPPYVTSCAVN